MSGKIGACQRSRTRRLAFTIVELLVVIAIIGVLVSILLPAVNGVRDSAARVQNANNLRQIGTALQTYEESKKTYPPLVRYSDRIPRTDDNRIKYAVSWAFELLPMLEQQNLYDAWDPEYRLTDPENRTAMTTPVSTYANPRRRDARSVGAFRGRAMKGSTLDYAANGGVVIDDSQPTDPGEFPAANLPSDPSSADSDNPYSDRFNARYSGPFHRDFAVSPAAVKDGLSNTLAVGDRWIGPPIPTGNQPWNDLAGFAGESYPTTVRYANPDDVSGSGLVFPTGKTDPSIFKFGSVKGSDCCFTFLDGRVIWLPYDTDPTVMQRLAAINDGQPIPPIE